MIRTFSSRLDPARHASLITVLDAWGELYGHVQRKLHAEMMKGRRWQGDLQKTFYEPFGLRSVDLAHIHSDLKAKHDAAKAVAEENRKTFEIKRREKQRQIDEKTKKIIKIAKEVADKQAKIDTLSLSTDPKKLVESLHIQREIRHFLVDEARLKEQLHQHKRRVNILDHKVKLASERMEEPSICFGSRDLFSEQNHLHLNGYRHHFQWKADWCSERSSNVYIEGNAFKPSGNELVRTSVNPSGGFNLQIRLPPALKHLATHHLSRGIDVVDALDVDFHHGADVIAKILARTEKAKINPRKTFDIEKGKLVDIPLTDEEKRDNEARRTLTWRFVRKMKTANVYVKDTSSKAEKKRVRSFDWYAFVTVDESISVVTRDFSRGALGVDFNEHHVSVTWISADGNFLQTWNIPTLTYGKSKSQAQDRLRKAASEIVTLAKQLGDLPIVSERLDFSEKKARLEVSTSKRHGRMLSSFSFSAFDRALHSACLRNGIWHERVDPAYTSIIGRVKFARRYGSSVHASAALCIARRAMRHSERLPKPSDDGHLIDIGDGVHVTLPPLEKMVGKHVWASWRLVARRIKADHAGQVRARRKPRSFFRTVGVSTLVPASTREVTPKPTVGSVGAFDS